MSSMYERIFGKTEDPIITAEKTYIYYNEHKSELDSEGKEILDKINKYIRHERDDKVFEYKNDLSEKVIKANKRELIEKIKSTTLLNEEEVLKNGKAVAEMIKKKNNDRNWAIMQNQTPTRPDSTSADYRSIQQRVRHGGRKSRKHRKSHKHRKSRKSRR